MIKRLFLLISLSIPLGIYAQVQLASELARLSTEQDISISFDPDLLRGITLSKQINAVDDLQKLLESSALILERVEANSFLIAPRKTQVKFDLDPGEVEEYQLSVVVGKGNTVLFQKFLTTERAISFDWTPNTDSIQIISSGHDPISLSHSELILTPTKNLKLTEKTVYLDEVVVEDYLTSNINLNLSSHTTTIRVEDMAFTPGETDGDILASIATLPGVNTPDTRAGNIFIHNSPSDQNLILYNHIPIYHKGHYFGSISPYNPEMIEEVTIHKNGFRPSLGNRVGGAIEIKSHDKLEDFRRSGINVNSLYANAFVRERISSKFGLSAAARHSLPNQWNSPKLDEISEVVYAGTVITNPQQGGILERTKVNFGDYNLKFLFQPNQTNSIELNSIYTRNFTTYQVDTSDVATTESMEFSNAGASIVWNSDINDRMNGKLIGVISDYRTAFNSGGRERRNNEFVSEELANNSVKDASLSYQLSINGKSRDLINLGIESQWTQLFFDYESEVPGKGRNLRSGENQSVLTHNIFGNYRFQRSNKFYFQAGIRGSYYDEESKFYLSPRVIANYDLSDEVTIKSSFGRYHQFLSQIKYLQFGNGGFYNELWRLSGRRQIRSLSSDQWMIGGVWSKGRFVVDTEFYGKRVNNINYSSTLFLENNTQYHPASLTIAGFDAFVKYQVSDNLLLWNSYEFSDASLSFDSLSAISYNYKYARPHQMKLGGLYTNGRWKVSTFYRLASGMYARSVDILSALNLGQAPVPPPGSGIPPPLIIPERYPTYQSLDFYVVYKIPTSDQRKFDIRFGLSLINVFNVDNQIDAVVRGADIPTLLERPGMDFAPNLDISISW